MTVTFSPLTHTTRKTRSKGFPVSHTWSFLQTYGFVSRSSSCQSQDSCSLHGFFQHVISGMHSLISADTFTSNLKKKRTRIISSENGQGSSSSMSLNSYGRKDSIRKNTYPIALSYLSRLIRRLKAFLKGATKLGLACRQVYSVTRQLFSQSLSKP